MDLEFMQRLGEIVKNIRKNNEMTQAELGEKVNRPQSSIARLESGQLGDTHFGFIIDLANALNVPVEELVARSFGRSFAPRQDAKKNQSLESLRVRLEETDPQSKRVLTDVFNSLIDLIKEVPKVPAGK